MMTAGELLPTGRGRAFVALLGAILMALAIVLGAHPSAVGATTTTGPTVSIDPAAVRGSFSDGQTVRVSVGPNAQFVPHSRVVILECTDPGGDPANLPTSLSGCDENTIQGDTTIVQSDGSFVEPQYNLYSLPSRVLGEQSNVRPVCNTTSKCVLFVGENQNDFTQPKLFSAPFIVSPPAAGVPATTAPAAAAPVQAPSAAVSLSVSQLAFTGAPSWLGWLAGAGAALVLLAAMGARAARRSGQ